MIFNKTKNIISNVTEISKRKKLAAGLALITILLISFWYCTPITKFEFKIRSFNISPASSSMRSGEEIQFNWEIQGSPYQVIIIFGDGNVKLLDDYDQINGISSGNILHSYALQGKYRPTLRMWDNWGKIFTKSLEIEVKNDPPIFNIAINGIMTEEVEPLHLSKAKPSIEVFEDEEVLVTVEDLKDNKGLKVDNMTFIYDYGSDKKNSKSNSITCSWQKSGIYPLIITAIGPQGELDQQTRYIGVKNKAPEAKFSLDYEYTENKVFMVEVDASYSKDTASDYNSLRYYWDWGDGTNDWGERAHHYYVDSAEYSITLCVRDDDGLYDICSKTVSYNNTKPEVKLVGPGSTMTLYEGQEIEFNAQGQDDSPDVVSLKYYWNFNSTPFDPTNLSAYELGGWINDHAFYDDFSGTITSAVVDPQGLYDSDTMEVKILNVDPKVNIYGVNVLSNVTFGLSRSVLDSNINFTFRLSNQQEKTYERMLNFENETSNIVISEVVPASMDVTDRWILTINSSQIIPENEEYQAFVIFKFVDGQALELVSDPFVSGEWGYYEEDLLDHFYDPYNFSYNYPLSINIEAFDPSIDDLYYTLTQIEKKALEISTTSELLNDEIILGDIHYEFQFYSINEKKFVNITATRIFDSISFKNNTYPVKLEFSNTIFPLINVKDLLENILNLKDLTVEGGLDSNTVLQAKVIDDDQGIAIQELNINTSSNFKIDNLTSRIDFGITTSNIPTPYGHIGPFLDSVYEDDKVKFTVKSNEQYVDKEGLVYMWDFSDGSHSYDKVTEHAWKIAGIYNITLTIADSRGNIYTDVETINILSKTPEIIEPYSFQGLEGQAVTLDIEVYGTNARDAKLSYEWYDHENKLISTEKTPTFILDDGKYIYRFVVKDGKENEKSCNITVFIHPLSPNLYVSNYMYYGASTEPLNPQDTTGELTLRAYVYDTLYDYEHISYYWTIKDGKKVYTFTQEGVKQYSEIKFKCLESTVYQGQVKVVDQDGKEKVQSFQIYSTIDDTFDGINDEFNAMLRTSTTDTDGDHLTDEYEINTSHTNYTNPDTDGDLLYDGYDEYNIGEQPLNTDPLDWDTDDDNLGDGREYYGWNVTIVYFENTTKFLVTSDPLDDDTDDDGLTDYEEYCVGSHPRMVDSDNDGLDDDVDPNPASWDGDGDLLADELELEFGTDPSNSDTDGDGLKDGEEIYGWGNGFNTNPLDADSDHDFAADGAEIQSYLVKLQFDEYDDMDERVNLTTPISLEFPHHFEQAAAAQISFGISYGEYGENATGSYGVSDEDVSDLSLILTKPDYGLLLANFTTNSSRYFSQVVDVSNIMNNETLGYDYYGDYEIGVGRILDDEEGNYIGTYFGPDFEFPESNWVNNSGTGCSVEEVREMVGGHSDIIKLSDAQQASRAYITYDDGIVRGHGSVQFYFMITGHLSESGTTYVFNSRRSTYPYEQVCFFIENGEWKCKDGSNYINVPNVNDPELNTWYAIKIDWCRDSTAWEGLANMRWQVSIDGISSGPLVYNNNNNNDPTYFRFFTDSANTEPYAIYYDALSFSWDEGYYEEDCLRPVPNYEFFESGGYPGTYSFNDDEDGIVPNGWTLSENRGGTCQVISALDGHNKVVEIHDTNSYFEVHLETSFTPQNIGTVEWWWRTTGTSPCQNFLFYDNLANLFGIQFHSSGYIQYQIPSGWSNIKTYNLNQWYHFRVDFNSLTDAYNVSIDGIQEITNAPYKTTGGGIEKLLSATGGSAYNFYSYFDAISFSWDPSYTIGLNKLGTFDNFYLEYFELSFSQYLDPNDPDFDDDGIMDGVEMGVLVDGISTIDFKDKYMPYYFNCSELAWWSFEEGSGSITEDISGENDGTLYGATWVAGIIGDHGLDFDGSNDYVSTTFDWSDYLNAGDPMHVSAWFKTSATSGLIIAGNPGGGPDNLIRMYDNGVVRVRLYGGTEGVSDSSGYNDNEWHLVDYGCDDTNSYFYIDGQKQSSSPSIGAYNRDVIWFGARPSTPQYFFDGSIDDIRIYNFSLSEDEIKWLYNNGTGQTTRLEHINYDISLYNQTINENTLDIQPNVQHLSSISYTYAGSTSGALSNTYVDDTNYHQVNAKSRFVPPYYNYYRLNIGFNFDPSLGGRDLFVSARIVTSIGAYLSINGIVVYSGTTIDFDDVLFEDVTSITLHTYEGSVYHNAKIYFFEIKDPDLGLDAEKDNATPYSLDIPQIGRVYDAELNVAFQSYGTLTGDGNCTFLLVKDYLNATLDDTILSQTIENFEAQQPFSYTLSLDLSLYLNQGIISEYYGTYTLYIGIYGTDRNDCFNLTRFEISIITYVQAESGDIEAWITDPALSDTDGDGWNDFYEIFTSETNPLQKDSDQDGAWDPDDRDPHKDILLEIQPYYTAFPSQIWPLPTPILQITVEFTLYDDPDNSYYILSQRYYANEWYQYLFPFAWRYCARHFNEKYYINIDDDFTEQDETIPMNIWGWSIYPAEACDYEYVGDTLEYTIGSIGHEQTLQVTHTNDDTVQVKVKTVAIERANTIAIFDPSTTDFTGHYNEKKRTTVIQLYLNTDTSFDGTPFVEGPNAIVIPTSLFTNTELHGYLEHDRLDETPLYSDEDGKYEFYSVDRDGNELEDACGDCDFHFVRFDISAEDAMEILYLLVSCLIDESTNETAVLYSYISTKDDGISASMMNLPSAAMAFIPLYSPYVSAENGDAPRPFDPLAWFLGILIMCINATFLGAGLLIVFLTMAAIAITTQNNDNAHNIGMQILTWLAYLIWLLIRAAVLVFTYVLLAVSILTITVSILTMIPLFLVMTALFGGTLNFGLFFFEVNIFNSTLKMENKIVWKYDSFMDLTFPYVEESMILNQTLIRETEQPVYLGTETEYTCASDSLIIPINAQVDIPEFSSESFSVMFGITAVISGVIQNLIFGGCGILARTYPHAAIIIAAIAFIVNFVVQCTTAAYLINLINSGTEQFSYMFLDFKDSASALLGFAAALLITGGLMFMVTTRNKALITPKGFIAVIIWLILWIISTYTKGSDFANIMSIISVITPLIGAIAFMGFSVFGKPFVVGGKGAEKSTPPAIKEMVKLYASWCCIFGYVMLLGYLSYLVTGEVVIFS